MERTGQILLGLDIGQRRVGVALYDSRHCGARPVATFDRAQGRAEREILQLIANRGIQNVVVGLPIGDLGQDTAQCENVRQFCRRLERRSPVKVIFQDEYGSTCEAAEILMANQGGKTSRSKSSLKNKGLLDATAAAVILEAYVQTLTS